ncbi:helix-turn-helix transcriptional regulator [Pusillimonas noertemannii]|uniref:AlpA family transcriptional regulator n=1 Tax=Pusillimonas noertemannii TaxID=305977 RepID=A0A2U1CRE5_9BURK|nr:AlpA family phage regulatory protein [Pusillimonas noertemannii]NYT67699.1 AlpA family phage regulatory protein [Pusillimonas noertemannii]PVY68371.1 AlpA family transcriptional regulator [Pusillimonas noertemannii]
MAQQETTQQPIPDDMIYDDLPTLSSYTNMGRTATYAAIKNLGFPEPYQLGARLVRWKRSEVKEWLENRPRGTRLTAADKARQKEAA